MWVFKIKNFLSRIQENILFLKNIVEDLSNLCVAWFNHQLRDQISMSYYLELNAGHLSYALIMDIWWNTLIINIRFELFDCLY